MIDFSRLSSRSVLGRVARLPLALLPRDLVVHVIQGPLRGARWVVGSGSHGFWLGSYEAQKQRLFASFVKPGSVVYDIGANVGFYTLIASRLTGPGGVVYSFEPLSRNVDYLRRHVRLNGCGNVEVLPVAVSREVGQRRFDPADGPSTGHLSPDGSVEVETVSIDSLIGMGRIRPPTLLKVDIEGAESEMLRGAEGTLREFGPRLFLATHGERNRIDCQGYLAALGYSLLPLESERLDKAVEFVAQREPEHLAVNGAYL